MNLHLDFFGTIFGILIQLMLTALHQLSYIAGKLVISLDYKKDLVFPQEIIMIVDIDLNLVLLNEGPRVLLKHVNQNIGLFKVLLVHLVLLTSLNSAQIVYITGSSINIRIKLWFFWGYHWIIIALFSELTHW